MFVLLKRTLSKGRGLYQKEMKVCFLLLVQGLLNACAFEVPLDKDKKVKATTALDCPKGYIEVPKLEGYTDENFCVAKYEMKASGGDYVSRADGLPVRSDCRNAPLFCHSEILLACQDIGSGYDLITNAEWQTIARNIEEVNYNWEDGDKGKTSLNIGNASTSLGSSTAAIIAATENALVASEKDTKPCFNLSFVTCNQQQWNFYRRTQQLSNGSFIWDFVGNVWEFVKDTLPVGPPPSSLNDDPESISGPIIDVNDTDYPDNFNLLIDGTMGEAQKIKQLFGPKKAYPSLTLAPYGALGELRFQPTVGGNLNNLIVRGGGHNIDSATPDNRISPGLFATFFTRSGTNSTISIHAGFRCTYRPTE